MVRKENVIETRGATFSQKKGGGYIMVYRDMSQIQADEICWSEGHVFTTVDYDCNRV